MDSLKLRIPDGLQMANSWMIGSGMGHAAISLESKEMREKIKKMTKREIEL